MTDNWDFYLCQIDGRQASIFVDLGIAEAAPVERFTSVAVVRVALRMPGPDGLSTSDEYDTLVLIEDMACPALEGSGLAIYVGRVTTNGFRDFLFYTRDPEGFGARAADATQTFPAYRFETHLREDSRWEGYFDFLYPPAEAMESIKNRRVCDALQEQGDTLTRRREIAHPPSAPAR